MTAKKIKKIREIPSKIKEVKLKIVELAQSEELEEKIEDANQEEFQEFMTSRESVVPVLKQSEESQSLEEQTRPSQADESQSGERNFSYQLRARAPYSSPQTQNQEEEQYRTAEQTPNITLAPLPRRELPGSGTLPLAESTPQRERARQTTSREISPEIEHAQERNYEESAGTIQRAKRRREMF